MSAVSLSPSLGKETINCDMLLTSVLVYEPFPLVLTIPYIYLGLRRGTLGMGDD